MLADENSNCAQPRVLITRGVLSAINNRRFGDELRMFITDNEEFFATSKYLAFDRVDLFMSLVQCCLFHVT